MPRISFHDPQYKIEKIHYVSHMSIYELYKKYKNNKGYRNSWNVSNVISDNLNILYKHINKKRKIDVDNIVYKDFGVEFLEFAVSQSHKKLRDIYIKMSKGFDDYNGEETGDYDIIIGIFDKHRFIPITIGIISKASVNECVYTYKYHRVKEKYNQLVSKYQEKDDEISKLKTHILELMYQPDGPGYNEAKMHFNTLIHN